MKLGVYTAILHDRPLREALEVIASLGLTGAEIGDIAFDNGIRVHELASVQASLEEAFMELTRESVEFHATVPGAGAGAGVPAPSAPTLVTEA